MIIRICLALLATLILTVVSASEFTSISDLAACLESGDINQVRKGGFTPLLYSCYIGEAAYVAWLFQLGADYEAQTDDQMNLFHCCVESENPAVLKEALTKAQSLDINAQDKYGATALHYAFWKGSKELADILLERGSRVDLKDARGWTLLHVAARMNNKDMAELVLSEAENSSAIINEAEHMHGWTALHLAAKANILEMVVWLIGNKADWTIRDHDNMTALDLTTSGEIKTKLSRLG